MRMRTGMRYHDKLTKELTVWKYMSDENASKLYLAQHALIGGHGLNRVENNNVRQVYNGLAAALTDSHTKLILFDSRQAAEFAKPSNSQWRENWSGKLNLPFEQFYLEFTEPIMMAEVEPGFNERARALMVLRHPISGIMHCTFFFEDHDKNGDEVFVDRTWQINKDWQAITRVHLTREEPDASIIPFAEIDDIIVAGCQAEYPDRHIGWWERIIMYYTAFLRWTVLYMMAKSIEIISEPLPRNVRRNMERKGIPNPWHIVRVEPRIVKRGGIPTEEGSSHGFRYDVMGHVRCLPSGEFIWVKPHQRGLQHELYIPKISKFEGGKVPDERMGDYLDQEVMNVSNN
jgi:hypothetical protein